MSDPTATLGFGDGRWPRVLTLAALGAGLARFASVWERLPPRMASHFGWHGEPNGFASPSHFAIAMLLASGTVVLITLLPMLLRVVPTQLINLPNRDYWLAPERRETSMKKLGGWLGWFALLTQGILLLAGELTIRANLAHASLENTAMWIGLGIYTVMLVVMLIALYRAFRLPRLA